MQLIDQSESVKTAFNSLNPDEVAEKIVMEFNHILNELAPSKKQEIGKDEIKYIDENINEMKKEADNNLTKAINSGDPTDWRISKYRRNKYTKALDSAKTIYYQAYFKCDYNLWRTIKIKEKLSTPTKIYTKGKKITSPRKTSN